MLAGFPSRGQQLKIPIACLLQQKIGKIINIFPLHGFGPKLVKLKNIIIFMDAVPLIPTFEAFPQIKSIKALRKLRKNHKSFNVFYTRLYIVYTLYQ